MLGFFLTDSVVCSVPAKGKNASFQIETSVDEKQSLSLLVQHVAVVPGQHFKWAVVESLTPS